MTAKNGVPGTVVAAISVVPIGLVAYFATKILLASPGNILALICLVLMGLTVGNLVRRNGLKHLVSILTLSAVVVGLLLALVLK
jgi:hypothetical protein